MRMVYYNETASIILFAMITYIMFFDFVYGNRLKIYDAIFLGLICDYCNDSALGASSITNLNMWLITKNYQKIFAVRNFVGLYAAFIISILQQTSVLIVINKIAGYQCSLTHMKSYLIITAFSYPIICNLHSHYPSVGGNERQ